MRAFLGRVLFAAIFVMSAIPKLQTFGTDGGPFAAYAGPKISNAYATIKALTGVDIPVVEVKYFIAISMLLEGVGGLLFIFGSSLGANMLMLFLFFVTPIMHNFWDLPAEEQQTEMVTFLKNVALFGALLMFTSAKSAMAAKVKAD